MHTDNTDAIKAAFNQAIADPTGASDDAFCRAMWQSFVEIFEEELAIELAARKPLRGEG